MNNINFDKTPDNVLFCIKTLINNAISEMYLFNYSSYRIGLPKYIKLFEIHNIINNFNNTNTSFKIELSEDKYHYILTVNRILYN